MRRATAALAAAASLLIAMPLAAAPRIDVAMSGDMLEVSATNAPPAAVLQRLAAAAGFSVEGLETLPTAPVDLHLEGPLERVLGLLLDPASRVATYAGDAKHLSRLVLLPTGANEPPRAARPAAAVKRDLPPDDPAVGASRLGGTTLRAEIGGTLGIRLP